MDIVSEDMKVVGVNRWGGGGGIQGIGEMDV